MPQRRKIMPARKVRRFDEKVLAALEAIDATLTGRNGRSTTEQGYDVPELEPAFGHLLHSLDQARLWAEEISWILNDSPGRPFPSNSAKPRELKR